jgi:hypothetical protein
MWALQGFVGLSGISKRHGGQVDTYKVGGVLPTCVRVLGVVFSYSSLKSCPFVVGRVKTGNLFEPRNLEGSTIGLTIQ